MDDLPLWPMSYPPAGYTAAGIVQAITQALVLHGIEEVYAFSNSWPLEKHPEFAQILDDWVAAGHHVANHTHGHVQLVDVCRRRSSPDIDWADELLAPVLARAPRSVSFAIPCAIGARRRKSFRR